MSPSFEFLEEPAHHFARRVELLGDRLVGDLEAPLERGRALDEPTGGPRRWAQRTAPSLVGTSPASGASRLCRM